MIGVPGNVVFSWLLRFRTNPDIPLKRPRSTRAQEVRIQSEAAGFLIRMFRPCSGSRMGGVYFLLLLVR